VLGAHVRHVPRNGLTHCNIGTKRKTAFLSAVSPNSDCRCQLGSNNGALATACQITDKAEAASEERKGGRGRRC